MRSLLKSLEERIIVWLVQRPLHMCRRDQLVDFLDSGLILL